MQPSVRIRHDSRYDYRLLVNVQTSAMGVNYVHSKLSRGVVFPASVDVQRSESDLRAHLTVATIGGACRHPDQTTAQAHSTKFKTTSVLAEYDPYSIFSWLVVKIYFHGDY